MGKKSKKNTRSELDDDALLEAFRDAADAKNKASTELISNLPPRANAASAVTPDGRLWIHGGECFVGDLTETYDELYFLDLNVSQDGWYRVKPAGGRYPRGRNGHQGVAVGSGFFIFGGEYTSKDGIDISHLGDLWYFDCCALSWKEIVGTPLPSPRSGHRLARIGGPSSSDAFVVFGGYHDTGRGKAKYYNDLHCIDAGSSVVCKTLKLQGEKPAPRSGCCLAATGTTVCVYGGTDTGGKALKDMWVVDVGSQVPTWRSLSFTPNGLQPRMGISMIVPDHAFLFGGLSLQPSPAKKSKKVPVTHGDTWHLDPVSREFREVAAADPSSAPTPRMSSVLQSYNGVLYLYGGVVEVGQGQQTLGDLWKGEIVDNGVAIRWKNISNTATALGCDEEDDEEDDEDESERDECAEELSLPRRLQEFSLKTIHEMNAARIASVNDTEKHLFYSEALAKLPEKPDAIVVAGHETYLKAALARQRGVNTIYCHELLAVHRSQVDLAQHILSENGIITEAVDDESYLCKQGTGDAPATVLVHELFGPLLMGAGCLDLLEQLRGQYRFIKEVIPRRATQWATLIECSAIETATHPTNVLGINLSNLSLVKDTICPMESRCGIDLSVVPYRCLSEPVPIATIDFLKDTKSTTSQETSHPVNILSSGTATAVLLTWEASSLDGTLAFSTQPQQGGVARSRSYGHCYQLLESFTASSGPPIALCVAESDSLTLITRFSRDRRGLQCQVIPTAEL